jgi:hypothetical protein
MRKNNRRSPALVVFAIFLSVIFLGHAASYARAGAVPPIIDLNGEAAGVDYNATFTEDEGAEPIVSATGLTVNNGEDTVLTAAKATLTSRPDGAAESLSANAGSTGLTVKYTSATGELTVTGNGSVDHYVQVLRSLTYNNTSQSPDNTTDRTVLITVSDGPQVSQPATSTIAIYAVNDAPVLDNSGDMVLPAVNEDDQNPGGNSVSGIIKSAEQQGQDRITDADKNALEGMAVIEAGSANGVWQFSVNAGSTWQAFGTVSNTSAVVLDETARIRFVPNANFIGSASFLFRAWDRAGGRPSGETGVDVSINGGTTPFSSASEMVTINVQSFNDLPIVDLNGPEEGTSYTAQFFENGSAVPIADFDATITDGDHTALAKITVTLTNRPDGNAESLAADTTGTNITAAPYNPTTGQLVLNGPESAQNFQQVLRLITYANSMVSPVTTARTITVVANDGVDDGPVATSSVTINPMNNAPVLDASAVLSLGDVAEDTLEPSGSPIAQVLGAADNPITDPDSGALEGIAVIGADTSHGVWQFSTTGPPAANWQPMGVVSDTAAVLLSDASWIRFVPAANYYGPSGGLLFRAWDQTAGGNGQRDVNVSVNGGNTAFSVNTNTISAVVTPLNDPPVLGGLPAAPLSYVEDAAPLPLPGISITVTDSDSPLLASATVRLTNPLDGDAEWMLAKTDGTSIVAIYEGGVMQLTGAGSPAAYQQVLRSIVYWNASQDPNPADRFFQISVADSQGSGTPRDIAVHVQPVNDPPELDLDGVGPDGNYATTFFINRGPVPIVAESLVANDIDDTTLRSATIRIVNLRNKQAEILSADLAGVGNIKANYDSTTGTLSLTGVDSVANYQRVLRTITYDNILPQPDTETRMVEFTVTDGVGISEVRQTVISLAEASIVQHYLPMVTWAYRRSEEPNDTCAESLGLMLNVDESFHADDVHDWFYFDLPAAADVTVELRDFTPADGQIVVAGEQEAGQGCAGLQLLGSDGSDQPNKTVDLDQQPAGRYYVWVINDGIAGSNITYRLFIRATP